MQSSVEEAVVAVVFSLAGGRLLTLFIREMAGTLVGPDTARPEHSNSRDIVRGISSFPSLPEKHPAGLDIPVNVQKAW